VGTFADLVKATEVAALCPVLPAAGDGSDGVGVLAVRALIADLCGTRGVSLAEFTETTEHRLRELLPEFGYARNPTDVTGQLLNDPGMFTAVAAAAAADPRTTWVLLQYANGAAHQ
jgi:acyl-CoA synthetase (NDP forming)